VPRLIASLVPDVTVPPIGSAVWGDTRIEVPAGTFENVFTGARVDARHGSLPASVLFDHFPVALLVPCST
jgi:maltooligosyltrehalose synthase